MSDFESDTNVAAGVRRLPTWRHAMSAEDAILGALSPLSVQLGAPRGGGGGGGGLLYAATGGRSPSDLYTIDPATGAVADTIGPIGFALTGMAYDRVGHVMYGSTSRIDPTNPHSLITLDLTTGAGTLIGGLTTDSQPVADLACDSHGNLFGWWEGPDGLASINKSTGAATLLGATYRTFGDGESFDASDVLYDMSLGDAGDLWTVDTATGVSTTVATLSGTPTSGGFTIAAAAFGPDATRSTLYAVIQGPPNYLIIVDTTTGVITTIGVTVSGLDALEWVY